MDGLIRVSIGSEPMQRVAAAVLMNSILRRTTRPVEFTQSWSPTVGWHTLIVSTRERIKHRERFRGTPFNVWRWLVPALYEHRGRALYLDCDQVVLADIADLWSVELDDAPVAMVCNAVGLFGDKKPKAGARQTSVMVLDCQRCSWQTERLFWLVDKGVLQYADLMQAVWLKEEVKELDPGWNHFGIHRPDTRLLHWSHVSSQPYRNPKHETADIFREELIKTIESGLLTADELRTEVKAGNVHKSYLGILKHL